MGILDSVERGLERVVNGAFAKTFRSGVQPVEISAALKRELDIGAVIVDRDRVLAPNRFLVRVSDADAARLERMGDTLERELVAIVKKHASRQGYQLLGDPDVEISVDPGLTTGVLEIDASQVEGSVAWVPVIEVNGGRHQLRTGSTIVGRGGDSEIRIDDTGASRQHLQLMWDGKAGMARDLGSTNGSKINGQRFREAALSPGTIITIGQTELVFQLLPARTQRAQSTQSAQSTARGSRASSSGAQSSGANGTQHSRGSHTQRGTPPGETPGIDQDFWSGL